jgi:hypothetical protein
MFAEDNRPPYQVIIKVSELLLKEKPLDSSIISSSEAKFSTNSTKIYKKHGVIEFLRYLSEINANVLLVDRDNEKLKEACTVLCDKGGLK